jgi:hypothetical protein
LNNKRDIIFFDKHDDVTHNDSGDVAFNKYKTEGDTMRMQEDAAREKKKGIETLEDIKAAGNELLATLDRMKELEAAYKEYESLKRKVDKIEPELSGVMRDMQLLAIDMGKFIMKVVNVPRYKVVKPAYKDYHEEALNRIKELDELAHGMLLEWEQIDMELKAKETKDIIKLEPKVEEGIGSGILNKFIRMFRSLKVKLNRTRDKFEDFKEFVSSNIGIGSGEELKTVDDVVETIVKKSMPIDNTAWRLLQEALND